MVPESSDRGSDASSDLLREEAHSVIDRQLTIIRQTEDKASKILRINLLIFGALITLASILVRLGGSNSTSLILESTFTTIFVFAGVTALIFSTISAGLTYTSSNVYVGAGGQDLENLRDLGEYSRTNENLIAGYSMWLKMNDYVFAKNNLGITVTIILIISGVLFLGLGTLSWITSGTYSKIAIVLIAALSLIPIIKTSELRSIFDDYRKSRSRAQDTIDEYYEALEHGKIDRLLEGSQKGKKESKLREVVTRAKSAEEWAANNPKAVVGDEKSIVNVTHNTVYKGGKIGNTQPDIVYEFSDGGIGIVEVKFSDEHHVLEDGIKQLLYYEKSYDKPELYLVAPGIPEEIQAELSEHNIQGVPLPDSR